MLLYGQRLLGFKTDNHLYSSLINRRNSDLFLIGLPPGISEKDKMKKYLGPSLKKCMFAVLLPIIFEVGR